MSDVPTFLVKATDTEGCQQLGFIGEFRLRICSTILQLIDRDLDIEVTHWPFHGIRNFGFTPLTFFLFSGTRCKTGEGKFSFQTFDGEHIHQCMAFQIGKLTNKDEKKVKEEKSKNIKDNVVAGMSNGFKGMPSKDSNSGNFPPNREEEDDYYNYDNYSHLNNKELHFQENTYGTSSASAPFGVPEVKRGPHSDYVNEVYEEVKDFS